MERLLRSAIALSAFVMITMGSPSPTSAEATAVIVCDRNASPTEQLATREARRYVYVCSGERLPVDDKAGAGSAIVIASKGSTLADGEAVKSLADGLGDQDYVLKTDAAHKRLYLLGGSPQASLYAVYRFAELLGVRFYLDGDVIPDERVPFALPVVDERHSPLFPLRGIQPFHDFPEGPDWWTPEHYQSIISQLPKLRMNFIGLHTYFGEPTVWIGAPEDIADNGSVKFSYPARWCNTAVTTGWGFNAKKTSDYSFGGALLFDRDGYGSEVSRGFETGTKTQEEHNEVFNRTGAMLQTAFAWARQLGVKTCVGTEVPLIVPAEVRERIGVKNPAFEAVGGTTACYRDAIEGTEDDPLYQDVRFNLDGYRFAVPNGAYKVTLKFCEVAYSQPGVRVFGVALQGKRVIEDLDTFARVGKDKALDLSFEGVEVRDGELAVDFLPKVEYPSVAAIGVEGANKTVKVNCGGPAYKDYQADDGAAVLDSAAIQKLYEGMFARIARCYPTDYYWFWTPESWTWQNVDEATVKATLDDVQTAIQAAKAIRAPFQLATCGWVLGPQNDRALFDKALPKDMPVSCINRQVGMDPVEPGFAEVQGRPKWAIPWLEDDPAMTSPQLWAGRMRRDAADALAYGCTGLMGIHWRTRILRPNVAALAQAAWDQGGWKANVIAKSGVAGGSVANFAGAEIAGTDDAALYQTVRYDLSAYRLGMPSGSYSVTLRFCEPHYKEAGKRVFGVKIQGKTAIDKLDVFAAVGANRALDKTFPDVKVDDGNLLIEFVKQVEMPCIAALEVNGANFAQKVNCGGEAYKDYSADLPQTSPHRPTGDFYRDWAAHEFGPAVGADAAAIFERMDGVMPRPSNWIGGPGGYAVERRPWDAVRQEYRFVDDFAGLRDRVTGAGSLCRFDYWLATFRYMRSTAEMCCVWAGFNRAMDEAKAAETVDLKKQRAKEVALPARIRLVEVIDEVGRQLMASVNTSGEMGTLANLEQHTFPGLLEQPGKELEALLGEPLPPDAWPSPVYQGPMRVFVPTIQTCVDAQQHLKLTVIALAEHPPREAHVCWREMAEGPFKKEPLTLVARGVYTTSLPAPKDDIEYYVEVISDGGDAVRWPGSAPVLNQTVVVMPVVAENALCLPADSH